MDQETWPYDTIEGKIHSGIQIMIKPDAFDILIELNKKFDADEYSVTATLATRIYTLKDNMSKEESKKYLDKVNTHFEKGGTLLFSLSDSGDLEVSLSE
ncbi:hypothetical protein KY338_06360 [Candidatus Woesearchaeota archaeon]|nr:hypothetical protein [Candidatus Woesearchaeota archaeon]MBW3005514.1 hypothetical protein [Candidatus Woesearchaeota archaeon]